MLSLSATFENSEGGLHRFSMKDPDRSKSAEEIRAGLEKLVSLNLFEKGEVGLFKKLVSAKFVETIETPIFDLRKEDLATAAPETDRSSEAIQMQTAPVQAAPVEPTSLQNAFQRPAQMSQLAPIHPLSAPQEVQQLEIIVPQDFDSASLSQEELIAFLTAQLPAGATLESLQTADIVFTLEGSEETIPKPALTETIMEEPKSIVPESSLEAEKNAERLSKPKSKFNLLPGFSLDKHRNKKVLKRIAKYWKKE